MGINIEVPFVLVENDAFPLTHYIMKPFSGYWRGKKREFLIIVSLEHIVSENAFGVLAEFFNKKFTISNARHFVLAACALYNFLREKAITSYLLPRSVDVENL